MTDPEIEILIGRFRRNMLLATGFRWAFLGVLAACVAAAGIWNRPEYQQAAWFTILTAVVGWTIVSWMSFGQTRQTGLAEAFLETGRLDEAEENLRAVLSGFGVFRNVKLVAGHHLATVLHTRREYRQGSAVCRELMRYRFGALRPVYVACRLLWADCLLMLDDVAGAFAAIRPLYDSRLTLDQQLRLLPIQIRYELAAGHEGGTVTDIRERVRFAEMMDSSTAGLVHAMLAEACRRQGLEVQQRYLARRAWLYTDVDVLVSHCPLIEPIVREHMGGRVWEA